jgi:hypothetical protein
MGKQGRKYKQLEEKGKFWKSKEEALDRTVWRTGFVRDNAPVVKQTTEWMNK